ncbi:hypothetical protein [Burkholderia cepacia]|uniref:hypothetical protein n=1 Tax=Burkholderia cepacia TaxID=292 RepID=UPI00158E86B8|nr:hypothetical protein [Burkholderia cepacia]
MIEKFIGKEISNYGVRNTWNLVKDGQYLYLSEVEDDHDRQYHLLSRSDLRKNEDSFYLYQENGFFQSSIKRPNVEDFVKAVIDDIGNEIKISLGFNRTIKFKKTA